MLLGILVTINPATYEQCPLSQATVLNVLFWICVLIPCLNPWTLKNMMDGFGNCAGWMQFGDPILTMLCICLQSACLFWFVFGFLSHVLVEGISYKWSVWRLCEPVHHTFTTTDTFSCGATCQPIGWKGLTGAWLEKQDKKCLPNKSFQLEHVYTWYLNHQLSWWWLTLLVETLANWLRPAGQRSLFMNHRPRQYLPMLGLEHGQPQTKPRPYQLGHPT